MMGAWQVAVGEYFFFFSSVLLYSLRQAHHKNRNR